MCDKITQTESKKNNSQRVIFILYFCVLLLFIFMRLFIMRSKFIIMRSKREIFFINLLIKIKNPEFYWLKIINLPDLLSDLFYKNLLHVIFLNCFVVIIHLLFVIFTVARSRSNLDTLLFYRLKTHTISTSNLFWVLI